MKEIPFFFLGHLSFFSAGVLSRVTWQLGYFSKKGFLSHLKGFLQFFKNYPPKSDDNYTFFKKTNPPELSA